MTYTATPIGKQHADPAVLGQSVVTFAVATALARRTVLMIRPLVRDRAGQNW